MEESRNYNIRVLPEALEDLYNIESWYIYNFNKDVAVKIRTVILNAISQLEFFPELGSLTPDEYLNQLGFKQLICKRHAIIYRAIEDTIFIYHIFDTRRDYPNIFKNTITSRNLVLQEGSLI